MAMPVLKAKNTTREFIDVFNGYNHKLKIQDGEFYETQNLTTEKYPLFATRQRRGKKAWTAPLFDSTAVYHRGDYVTRWKQVSPPSTGYMATYRVKPPYASLAPGPFDPDEWDEVETMFSNTRAILAKDALCWVDGDVLYIDGKATPVIGLQTTKPTQLVSMNAYVCVFPDKKYINVLDQTDYGSMESIFYTTFYNYTLQACHEDGSVYSNVYYSKPANPENGAIWVDTDTRTAREYSTATESWVVLETPYTRITFPEGAGTLPSMFNEYDGVKIGGLPGEDDAVSKIIYAIGGNAAGDGVAAVNDWIAIAGMYAQSGTYYAGISIYRTVPDMDYVCEAGNRLWGCKYGRVNGKNINEIYCCALGDFKNWEQYLGISTDSWRASRGSDGEWTGCINYLGTPTFFKENMIHPVTISSTGAHQVSDIPARGVQKGSGKSLAVVNETLYYKSRTGVMAYQGGMPADVADQLGNEKYYNAIAGVFGQNYYISMQDKDDHWQFFCYDAGRNIWMHEDDLHAEDFAALGDELYVLADGDILALNGTEGDLEPPVSWMAESGILPYRYPDKKYVYRYDFSLMMEQNSKMKLYIEYDSNGVWTFMGDVVMDSTPSTTGSKTIPVRPRRCDHLRIRIEGVGDVRILSITRILEKGSDV